MLPALSGRAGPRKGHSVRVRVLGISPLSDRPEWRSPWERASRSASGSGAGPCRALPTGTGAGPCRALPRAPELLGAHRPAPPGSAARRLSPTRGPGGGMQAARALILTRSAVSVRSVLSFPLQQQHLLALRFALQNLTRFYPKYYRLLDEILSAVFAQSWRLAREGAVRSSPHRYAFPTPYRTAFFLFARVRLL